MKKKTWIAAAGAAAFLILVLLLLLTIGNRQGKAVTADPGSKYPYTVRQTKKGLLVAISAGEEGYRWSLASEDPYTVYPYEKSNTAQKSELLLSPVLDGTAAVTITLVNSEFPYDAAYQLSLMVRTSENTVELLQAGHRAYPDAVYDAKGRYSIYPTADGGYLIRVHNGEGSEWIASLQSGSADVRWYQPDRITETPEQTGETETLPAEETWFQVSDNGADDASVHLVDRKQGDVLALEFSRSTEGVFCLTAYEMRADADTPDREAASPEWLLPGGAALLECGTEELYSQENGQALQADTAVFFWKETSWKLYRADGNSRKALALRDYRTSDSVPDEEFELDTLWIYRSDAQWCCAWDGGNAGYLLTGLDTDRETLETIMAVLLERSP